MNRISARNLTLALVSYLDSRRMWHVDATHEKGTAIGAGAGAAVGHAVGGGVLGTVRRSSRGRRYRP